MTHRQNLEQGSHLFRIDKALEPRRDGLLLRLVRDAPEPLGAVFDTERAEKAPLRDRAVNGKPVRQRDIGDVFEIDMRGDIARTRRIEKTGKFVVFYALDGFADC